MSREHSLPAISRRPASSFGRYAPAAALALACLLAGARPSPAQQVEDTQNTPDSGGRGVMRVDPSTLYGAAGSDDERTERFIGRFYVGAYGRGPTAASRSSGGAL